MELILKNSHLIALLIGSAMVLIEIYSWKISKENFVAHQETKVKIFPFKLVIHSSQMKV